jgi:lysophospholipase L1-like esterase
MRRLLLALLVLAAAVLVPATSPAAAVPASITVLRLGDSRTIGVGSSWGTGYAPELQRLLGQAGIAVAYAPIGGGTGWTVQDLRTIVDSAMASAPDVVLLAVGTNNAAGACAVAPCAGMAGYQGQFHALVQRILTLSASVHVFVAEIQYSSAPWAGQEVYTNIAHITSTWQPWCASRCTLVHLQGIPRCGYLGADGVHPTDAGYQVMADQWARAVLARYGVAVWPAKVRESDAPRPALEVPAVRAANGC